MKIREWGKLFGKRQKCNRLESREKFWSQKIIFLYPIFILEVRVNRELLKQIKQVSLCVHTHACIYMNYRNICVFTHVFIRFKFQRNQMLRYGCNHIEHKENLWKFWETLGIFTSVLRLEALWQVCLLLVFFQSVCPVSKPYIHVLQHELHYDITGKTRKKENSIWFSFSKIISSSWKLILGL